jgi:hypothetical protein
MHSSTEPSMAVLIIIQHSLQSDAYLQVNLKLLSDTRVEESLLEFSNDFDDEYLECRLFRQMVTVLHDWMLPFSQPKLESSVISDSCNVDSPVEILISHTFFESKYLEKVKQTLPDAWKLFQKIYQDAKDAVSDSDELSEFFEHLHASLQLYTDNLIPSTTEHSLIWLMRICVAAAYAEFDLTLESLQYSTPVQLAFASLDLTTSTSPELAEYRNLFKHCSSTALTSSSCRKL